MTTSCASPMTRTERRHPLPARARGRPLPALRRGHGATSAAAGREKRLLHEPRAESGPISNSSPDRMIRAAAGFSGFCVRFLVFGVIVDDDADVLQFLTSSVFTGLSQRSLNEHDTFLELCDGLDLIIVGVDEVDGEVAARPVRSSIWLWLISTCQSGVSASTAGEDGDLVVAHVEVDQLPELRNDGDIRDRVER